MKWTQKPEPRLGDHRHRSGFLLFPKCIDNEWRWWERAEWTEQFIGFWSVRTWGPVAWGHLTSSSPLLFLNQRPSKVPPT